MRRYVLEGEWSGYRSSQQRLVHREVISDKKAKKLVLNCIRYTDGTCLYISVRPAKPRERVQNINGYTSLIKKALMLNKEYVSVEECK